MAELADGLGLDIDRLTRQVAFLKDRAQAHETEEPKQSDRSKKELQLACAATLRRDAGALALLLGDVQGAKREFRAAGRTFLELGLFTGRFWLRLASDGLEVGTGWGDEATDWIEESLRPDKSHSRKDADVISRSYARFASHAPLQLLSLVQSDFHSDAPGSRAAKIARERLAPNAAFPVGVTEIPLGSYLNLFDELRFGDLGASARDSLIGLAIRRSEVITAARQDHFHWRRMQKPAALIDFDLLALGLAALASGDDLEANVLPIVRARGLAATLPFELARKLQSASEQ